MFQKMFFATLLTFSVSGFATETVSEPKTQVLKVSGMHCGSCVKAITKKVCGEKVFAACEVNLLDSKKQTGEIRITTNPGQTLELDKIKTQVKDIGYEVTN